MTTVAVTATHIVADGQSTAGDERLRTNSRKIHVHKATKDRPARIFALTGSRAMTDPLIEWYQGGHDAKAIPSVAGASFTLIVIEPDPDNPAAPRLSIFTDDMPYRGTLPLPQAFGTGGSYAQGVLLYGGTAREAVEIAIKLDIKSGGEIHEVNIAEALGLHAPAKSNGLGITPHAPQDRPAASAL